MNSAVFSFYVECEELPELVCYNTDIGYLIRRLSMTQEFYLDDDGIRLHLKLERPEDAEKTETKLSFLLDDIKDED